MIFADTSAWIAYLDKESPHHAEAVQKIEANKDRLLTSKHVLWELSRVAQSEECSRLVWQFVGIRKDQLIRTSEEEELEAWELYFKHDGVCPSFTDCTSFIIINKYAILEYLSFNQWLLKEVRDER